MVSQVGLGWIITCTPFDDSDYTQWLYDGEVHITDNTDVGAELLLSPVDDRNHSHNYTCRRFSSANGATDIVMYISVVSKLCP